MDNQNQPSKHRNGSISIKVVGEKSISTDMTYDVPTVNSITPRRAVFSYAPAARDWSTTSRIYTEICVFLQWIRSLQIDARGYTSLVLVEQKNMNKHTCDPHHKEISPKIGVRAFLPVVARTCEMWCTMIVSSCMIFHRTTKECSWPLPHACWYQITFPGDTASTIHTIRWCHYVVG